eukprot:RCo053378
MPPRLPLTAASRALRATILVFTNPNVLMTAALAILMGTSYALSRVNYLLFHILVELFSVIVAATTAILAFHTRQIADNVVFMALGICYGFTGALDLAHVLTYKGMNLTEFDKNPDAAAQLWIAARFLESASMVVIIAFHSHLKGRKWASKSFLGCMLLGTVMVFASIFWWRSFPVCNPGTGLTPFKKGMEFVICAVWVVVLCLLLYPWWPVKVGYWLRYELPNMGAHSHRRLIAGVLFSIVAEVLFAVYVDVYSLINILGHCFKVAAYTCWYLAIVREMLEDPYTVLFSSICETNKELLETRQQWAAELQSTRQAWKDRTDMIATMSHELRTPLNGISGMVELLQMTELNEEQKQCLVTVRDAISAMMVVINDLLDFFKLEAQKIKLESLPVAVTEVAQSVMNLYRQQLKPGVKGLVEGDASLSFTGDPTRIRQILSNLVSNSAKFTPTGSICIKVSAGEGTQGGVQFLVQDTGLGIPRERLPSMFQAFSQADGTISRRFGGTGLGLHIVKQLVELMGGTITVDSVLNEGTTFTVKLPLPLSGNVVVKAPTTSVESVVPQFPGFEVVAVDDTPINLAVLQGFGRRVGCNMHLLSSGTRAIDFFQTESADLCLLDIWMPEIDGIETAQRLRGMGVGVPLVALTADISSEVLSKCQGLFVQVAHKPLTFQAFIELLTHFRQLRDFGVFDPQARLSMVSEVQLSNREASAHSTIPLFGYLPPEHEPEPEPEILQRPSFFRV